MSEPIILHVCPRPAPEEFPRDGLVCTGFGAAQVLRDGEVVLDGNDFDEGPEVTGEDAERAAAADPDHVWEIWLLAPLQERRYRREGREIGRWVLVETGDGFA
jgi:hypothetical protein